MDVHSSTAKVTVLTCGNFAAQMSDMANRANTLISAGASAQDVVIFAASPDAARMLKNEVCGTAAESVLITTPYEYAMSIIGCPECQEFTGRGAHVLGPQDMNILLEDIKTGGLRTNKLRRMLRFFDRTLTEVGDEGLWYTSQDDLENYQLMSDLLKFNGGILPSEVGNLVFRFLQADSEQRARFGFKNVLVSDFQNLNRASQGICCALASDELVVFADAALSRAVYDAFPYPAGVAELLECNPDATCIELEGTAPAGRLGEVSVTLRAEAAGEGRSPFLDNNYPEVEEPKYGEELEIIECDDEAVEIMAAIAQVTEAIADGMKPEDILIVTPNAIWTKNIAKGLAAASVPVSTKSNNTVLACDIRDYEMALPARIHTMLELVADPEDAVAWRSWCGYGLWLTNSDEFGPLRERAAEQGLGLVEMMEVVRTAEDPRLYRAGNITEAYRLGRQVIDEVSDKTGDALLNAIAFAMTGEENALPKSLERLYGPFGAETTAEQMLTNARAKGFASSFADNGGVRVGTAGNAYGCAPKLTVWTGFANGFIPSHDYFDNIASSDLGQQREWLTCCRLILGVISATEKLVVTYPDHISAQVAERVGALAQRIQLIDRKKVYMQKPSEFVKVLLS